MLIKYLEGIGDIFVIRLLELGERGYFSPASVFGCQMCEITEVSVSQAARFCQIVFAIEIIVKEQKAFFLLYKVFSTFNHYFRIIIYLLTSTSFVPFSYKTNYIEFLCSHCL